jgi:hypothetical protein
MKTLLKSLSVIVLALMVAIPTAMASTVAEAQAAISNLRSLTQVLPVTKASEATKIRADLTKRLNEASALLNRGGVDNYYRAAIKVYEFGKKLAGYINQGRVSYAEAVVLFDLSVAANDCIVAIYCPECVYP